ncbi:MAG: hypothetical protein ACERKV_01280 [Clostridiaceae bacterium]
MNNVEKLDSEIVKKISEKFILEKCEIGDLKEFTYPKVLPIMKYKADKYKVDKLGNMTILKCKMFNLMSLVTVVLTPDLSRNIPFVIIDIVCVRNKYISFFEFFDIHTNNDEAIEKFKEDTLKIKKKYKDLDEHIEKPNWYVPIRAKYSLLKHGNKDKEYEISNMIMECLDNYLLFVSKAKEPEDIVSSRERLTMFIDDLINKGNPSSKPISKALGNEKAKKFFEDVVFYMEPF